MESLNDKFQVTKDELQRLCRRYWEGETSVEEEAFLCRCFATLPASALPEEVAIYRSYFLSLATLRDASLGEDFDRMMLQLVDDHPSKGVVVKARRLSPATRLLPLARAAAVVAAVVGIGVLLQRSWTGGGADGAGAVAATADTIISTNPSAPSIAQGQEVQDQEEAVDPMVLGPNDALLDHQRWDSLQRL